MLLALDTSTAALTVAVHDGRPDGVVLASRSEIRANRHAEYLAPLVAAVLVEAGSDITEVDTIVVGVGPGPFTGLRVGLTTARVLGLALPAAVVGVCSLDALAQSVLASGAVGGPDTAARSREGSAGSFLVATDARRREVYWAGYQMDAGWARRVEGPAVGPPDGVARRGRPVFGRGVELYPDPLGPLLTVTPAGIAVPLDVDAAALAVLVADGAAEVLAPQPLYLRRPDAQEPGARKRVTR